MIGPMSSAREILEHLCSEGDDVWQTGMLGLMSTTIFPILEAWSDHRKVEIVKKNDRKGIKLIDHVVIGDYDITLWRVPVETDFYSTGILWAVSINSDQHDPSDANVQTLKFPGSSLRHLPADSISEVFRGWIEEYGKLAVGTVSLDRLLLYRRICVREGFRVTDMNPNLPRAGFFIE